jgi:hypothetical protein
MTANAFWSGRPVEAEGRAEGAGREQAPGQGGQKGDVVRVSAADVVANAGLQPPTAQTFADLEVPDTFRQAVEQELTRDEKLLWVGRPSRNRQVHPQHPVMPVVGIGFLAFAGVLFLTSLVWGAATKFGGGPASGCFFAVILAGVGGVLLLISKIDPTKNLRHCYAVTNRRALLVEFSMLHRRPVAQSYLPQQLLGLERKDNVAVPGAGDLVFEYVFALAGNSMNASGSFHQQGPSAGLSNAPQRIPRGFMWLDQVREVEDLIRTSLLQGLEQALDQSDAAEPVAVSCACGVTLEGPAALAGKWVKCPRCAAAVPLASRDAAAAPCLGDESVPADLKAKALAGLDGNEKPVWVGQPVPKLILIRSGIYAALGAAGMLAALLWLLLTLAPAKAPPPVVQRGKQVAAAPAKAPGGNPLFPVGLFLLSACGPAVSWVHWRAARRTCYALTNRRALVYKEGLFGPTRESYSPLEVAAMKRSDSWTVRGSGDLIFRTVQVVTTSRTRGVSRSSVKTTHYGFLAVAPVGDVEKLVRETLIDRFVDKLAQANAG